MGLRGGMLSGYLHMISGVNEKSVRQGIDRNPLAVVQDLKAVKLVLHEEGKETVIRVRRQAHCQFRLRTRRVQVSHKKLMGDRSYFHFLVYIVLFQPQTFWDPFEQLTCELSSSYAVFMQNLPVYENETKLFFKKKQTAK